MSLSKHIKNGLIIIGSMLCVLALGFISQFAAPYIAAFDRWVTANEDLLSILMPTLFIGVVVGMYLYRPKINNE